MQSIDIVKESEIVKTPRVQQLSGMFDIPPQERSAQSWEVRLPIDEKPWNIGLIVGPSGSGKTIIANELFSDYIREHFEWDAEKSILDGFPSETGIKEISGLLSSVGFSSPPAWMKPFHVLSNGEKFRVTIARALVESPELCVIDEFSSVVDRTVAQIGSSAIAKTVRRMDKQFIAVSCHYDIEEWLQPDWVLRVHDLSFEWRFLQRRPEINLKICKVHSNAWEFFKKYHYLTAGHNKAAQCFVAYYCSMPVAFMSYLHFQNRWLKKTKKGHRLVVLPDYQGIGVGSKLIEYIVSCVKAVGFDFIGRTAQPAVNHYRAKSNQWKCISKPGISVNRGGKGKVGTVMHTGRLVSTYRYVGPPADYKEAKELLQC